MQLKAISHIVLSLFCCSAASASYEISPATLQKHVTYLSSPALEGRLTGSPGEQLATDYIAAYFKQLGLTPAGDHGSYIQEFNFTAGVALGKNNRLTITDSSGKTTKLSLNKDWRPLAFSDDATFTNVEFIMAGYGITAPATGPLPAYDSYKNLTLKNKWVVVFRYLPENISPARRRQLSQYASLRYKAFTAKQHGARGVIFVNVPNTKMNDELVPLLFDTSLAGSGIVVLSVSNKVSNDLLQPSTRLNGQTNIAKITRHGHNVLAKLTVGTNTNELLVVGAHLDHLGHGELSGSRANDLEKGKIHPGADDNASGVASIMEVAAKLRDLKTQGKLPGNRDILLAAWSGEEFGILGSSHFVKNFMRASTSLQPAIAAAINLDMVGNLRKKLVLQGCGSSADWPGLLNRLRDGHSISLVRQNDPYLPTDSTAFYLQGVPALNFFTGATDAYHSPKDLASTLNYQGIKQIDDLLVALILELEAKPDMISYQSVPKPGDRSQHSLRIYLGTIPDYTSGVKMGVKLAGVAQNSPAQQAGLQHDDVITELDGNRIHDIYDYTYALNALHAGEPAKMKVRRGQTNIDLTVVARYRD
jgi:hypothetical protein